MQTLAIHIGPRCSIAYGNPDRISFTGANLGSNFLFELADVAHRPGRLRVVVNAAPAESETAAAISEWCRRRDVPRVTIASEACAHWCGDAGADDARGALGLLDFQFFEDWKAAHPMPRPH